MTAAISLPTTRGGIEKFEFAGHTVPHPPPEPLRSRKVFAAAHVVADPLGDPIGTRAVDWDATLAYRRHLWSLGLGVAEAMDTAQRGSGLDRSLVTPLIERSIEAARDVGGEVTSGVNTDDLDGFDHSLDAVVGSYLDQLTFVQGLGGSVAVMASRALAAVARGPEDYVEVYGRILEQAVDPVILHWLGPQFDPALAGYWGSPQLDEAMATVLAIIGEHPDRVDGVKISLLDAELEVALRNQLPEGVRCYTGDDFNYPELIAGDQNGFSHALLGIFDAIAPVAMTALHQLEAGELTAYHELLRPTVALSRHIFEEPTLDYKTGVVFLAYLTGHQEHFRMVGGRESARSIVHLAEIVRLGDEARLFADPEDVVRRLRPVLRLAGID